MIRILLVDAESLLHPSGGAYPDARAALDALGRLETPQGERLLLAAAACGGRTPPEVADQVMALGFSGLLAPNAAVRLPLGGGSAERRALAAELQSLLPGVQLGACAAVLKDEARVLSCRWLGIPALAPGFDNMEWRDIPLMIARLMDPSNLHNLGLALARYVPAEVEDVSVTSAEPKRLIGRAMRWSPLPGTGRALPEGLCVLLPVELALKIEPNGARIESCSVGVPSSGELDAAAAAAEDLFARGQVALQPDQVSPATTHLVEHRDGGRRLLKTCRRM